MSTDAWQAEFNGVQASLLKKLEQKQFIDCDLVFTCSVDDSVLGREMAPQTKFVVVGNGVDTEYFHPPAQQRRASHPTLLFTGTFGYGPNRDGLKYFVDEIFPFIKQAKPETEFIFAGYEAQRAMTNLESATTTFVASQVLPTFDPVFIRHGSLSSRFVRAAAPG